MGCKIRPVSDARGGTGAIGVSLVHGSFSPKFCTDHHCEILHLRLLARLPKTKSDFLWWLGMVKRRWFTCIHSRVSR